jgi:hypothetical protein
MDRARAVKQSIQKNLETDRVVDDKEQCSRLMMILVCLKIRFNLSGDIAKNFAILSDIYNKLYTWNLMVSRAQLDSIRRDPTRGKPRACMDPVSPAAT